MAEDYEAARVLLPVAPSFRGVIDSIRAEAQRWGGAAGDEFTRTFNQRVGRGTDAPVGPSRQNAGRSGDTAGRSFADTFRARVTAALRSLPEVRIGAATTEAEQKIRDIHAELEQLSHTTIGVDIDAPTALARIEALQEQLDVLSASAPTVEVRIDTARASSALAALRAEVDAATRPADIEVTVRAQGAFTDKLRAQLQAALTSLPDVQIDADTSSADLDIAALRDRIQQLQARVGVDLDPEEALAEIEVLTGKLRELGTVDARPDVRVDTARAIADLEVVKAEVDRLDHHDPVITPKVESAPAIGGLFSVLSAGIALGPALIPVAAAIVGAIGAIGPAAIAAAAGLGAVLIGGEGVISAVTKGIQAQDAQAKSSATASAATVAAAQAAKRAAEQEQQAVEQEQQAEQNLANTQADVAYAAKQAAQSVADARRQAARSAADDARTVADAERSLAQARAAAAQQDQQAQVNVGSARAGIGDARSQARDNNATALAAAQQAEQNLAGTQQRARDAQVALNEARVQAARDIVTLTNDLADSRLKQRADSLDVVDAKRQLDLALADPHGTAESRAKAQLAYDEAKQQLTDQKTTTVQLAAEKKKSDKDGVDGSDKVRTAQEQLAQAQQAVADAQKAAARATADIQKTRVAGDKQIADAQQAYADAVKDEQQQELQGDEQIRAARDALANAQRQQARDRQDEAEAVANAEAAEAEQQRQAAVQLAAAQQGIADAQRAVADAQTAVTSAAAKTAAVSDSSTAAAKAALAGLSPIQRRVAQEILNLRGPFKQLQRQVGDALFAPLLQAAPALKPLGPIIAGLLTDAAGAVGYVGAGAERALGSKAWQDRLKFVDSFTSRFISKMGTIGGNFLTGITDIVLAFTPLTDLLLGGGGKGPKDKGTGLVGLSARFAAFAAGLSKNKDFQSFLSYIEQSAPTVVGILGDLFKIAGKLLIGLAPLGSLLLKGIKPALDFLARQNPAVLLGIAAGISAVVIVIAALAGAIPVVVGAAVVFAVALDGLLAKPLTRFVQFMAGIGPSLVSGLKQGLSTGYHAVVHFFETLADDVISTIKSKLGIASPSTVFATIGSDILSGLLGGLQSGLAAVGRFFTTTLPNLAKGLPATIASKFGPSKVGSTISTWFDNGYHGVVHAIDRAKTAITGLPGKLIAKFGASSIGQTIGGWFTNAYTNITAEVAAAKAFLTGLPDALLQKFGNSRIGSTVGSWFANAYTNVTTAIGKAVTYVTGLPATLLAKFGPSSIASTVKTWFTDARTAIGTVLADIGSDIGSWVTKSLPLKLLKLGSAFLKPINFVIGTVLDDGLINAFNKISGVVGIPAIPAIPKIVAPPGYAMGGIYPGYTPGRDIGLASVSGGEAIMRPEWTKAVGADYVDAANTAARAGGVSGVQRFMGGFSLGGIIGGLWDKVKSTAGGILGSLNPEHVLKKLFGPILGRIDALDANPLGAVLKGVGHTLLSGAEKKLLALVLGAAGTGWEYPLNPVPGVTLPFDAQTSRGSHAGVDWGAPSGSTLYAAHSGTVANVYGPEGPGGNMLLIRADGTPYYYNYEHLSRDDVHAGQKVTLGEVVGLSGGIAGALGSGDASGPHLHFGIGVTPDVGSYASHPGKVDPVAFLASQHAKKGGTVGGGGGGNDGGGGPVTIPGGSKGAYEKYAFSLFPQYQWGADQQQPLVQIVDGESGWNPTAQNPTSSAYGIFQFLDSTWASVKGGTAKTSDPSLQIQDGLKYINQRYTNPSGGEAHEQQFGWFDSGGVLAPGYTLAFNGTGKNEVVLTGDQAAELVTALSPLRTVTGGPHHRLVQPAKWVTGPVSTGPLQLIPKIPVGAPVSPVTAPVAAGGTGAGTRPAPVVQQSFYTQGYDEESLARYSARRMGDVLV